MAAGEQLEVSSSPEMDRRRGGSPPGKTPPVATFGFTPAQQIMFQSSNMNGQQVVMVTPEVARSLGIVAPSDGTPATEAAIQIQQGTGDVSVSVMDTEEDGMIDPDQFLAMELASGKAEAVVDEDLTSLSWLHSKNLLKASDVQFRSEAGAGGDAAQRQQPPPSRSGPMSAAPLLVEETAVSEFSEESPTSDYLEELPEAPSAAATAAARSAAAAVARSAAAAQEAEENGDCLVHPVGGWSYSKVKRHPPHLPYDPKVHVHFKPPFSFSCLIFMSIEDSPNKALPVKEIYNWIQEHFPFYQVAPIGWKNSVRHNLSLNKCFKKVDKSPGAGKGSLWTVDALFRPNLIQALKRSPCVQETPLGAGGRPAYRPWTAATTALSGPPPPALPPAGPDAAGPPRQPAVRRPSAAGRAVAAAALGESPSADSLQAGMVSTTARGAARRRPGRGAKRSSSGQMRPQSDESGPNPELFPLLSRRLLSGSGDSCGSTGGHQGGATGDDEAADGERKLVIVQEPPPEEALPARCRVKVVRRPREAVHDPPSFDQRRTSGYGEPPSPTALLSSDRLDPRLVIIRRCPEEEHTYARDPLRRHASPAHLSDDEAFSDDSNLSIHDPSGRPGGLSPEEGADLLLNLAGVPLSDAARTPRPAAGGRRGSAQPAGRPRAGAGGGGLLR